MFESLTYYFIARKFRGYKPRPVTKKTIDAWLSQFGKKNRKFLLKLLKYVIFVDEAETRNRLVEQNGLLLDRLAKAGVSPEKIIYISIDEAASSSHVMLNMLKESALLERQKCRFVDSKDLLGLNKCTNEIGEGAVVYVDDFVGSGKQFCRSRDFAAEHVVGTFSEFLLVPCVCEEAIYELGKRGVECYHGHLHTKAERPLHPNSNIIPPGVKARLIELSEEIDKKNALGFGSLATSVVFYRNAPNTVPLVLRGNIGQQKFVGILPRTTDLLPPILTQPSTRNPGASESV